MKILTKKKQKEILDKLFEVSKACIMYIPNSGGKYEDRTDYMKVSDEICDIAEAIGGLSAAFTHEVKCVKFIEELINEEEQKREEKDHEQIQNV